jgi:L-asparaginase
MSIKIITTGGTIDDLDYECTEDEPKNHTSCIPNLVQQLKYSGEYTIEALFHKDSRHITLEDRELIFHRCELSREDKIIITHGTITMVNTAKYLGQKNISKTIILVGSLLPANRKNSDAIANLSTALHAVQKLPYGVYISMQGEIFSWENVKKNREK